MKNIVMYENLLGYGLKHFCACCGKEITPENNNAVAKKDKRLNAVGYYYVAVADEEDVNGYDWCNFCKPCYDKLTAECKTLEDLYNNYPHNTYTE